jgi:hypothetical protein
LEFECLIAPHLNGKAALYVGKIIGRALLGISIVIHFKAHAHQCIVRG